MCKKILVMCMISAALLAGCRNKTADVKNTSSEASVEASSDPMASDISEDFKVSSEAASLVPAPGGEAQKKIWDLTSSDKYLRAEPVKRHEQADSLLKELQEENLISDVEYHNKDFTYTFTYEDGSEGGFDLNVEGPQSGQLFD